MKVVLEKCKGCMECAEVCPMRAISKNADGKAQIDQNVCLGCGCCASCCNNSAIEFE